MALSGANAPALPKGEPRTLPLRLASHFGRGGIERSEMTERASPLTKRVQRMKQTTVIKNNQMLDTARKLRREMTPQERKLWYLFLRRYPVKIYKQRIIESFIVDFYCAEARLVIEADGSQHYTEQGQCHDHERSLILEQYGLKILRFSNREIDYEFESVCEQIHNEIQKRCRT